MTTWAGRQANTIRWAAASLLALAGIAAAANIGLTPPSPSLPDVALITALAERAQGTIQAPALKVPAGGSGVTIRRQPAGNAAAQPTAPTARTSAKRPPASRSGVPPVVRLDPVKNLALVGVTGMGGDEQAYLVDLNTNERQAAGEGETIFGLKLDEIDDDHVVLSRGTEKYSLKLGEKQVPVASAPDYGGSDPGGFGFGGGLGFGGNGGFGRNRGGFGGGFQPSFNRGSFGGNFGGGGSSSNRPGSNGFGAMTFGNGMNRGGFNFGGNRGGGGGNRGGGATMRTGTTGGAFGGGGSGTGTTRTASTTSTANPQTARRTGSRLAGGATPMPSPQGLSNPQTQRRRGTTSGQAFGQQSPQTGGTSGTRTPGATGGGAGRTTTGTR